MESKQFKFAVLATDVVIFTIKDNNLAALLIKMKKKPYTDFWAVPGGLVKPNESLVKTAKQHLLAKTNLKNIYLEQLYTFGSINRDPFGRVVSVAYFALVPNDNLELKTTTEYADVAWFPVNKLPKLAYDHQEMVECAVSRLQTKLGYTNVVYSLLPDKFTLGELQKTYEIILNKKIDKRNFRKKVAILKLIKKTDEMATGKANRPAAFYKFIKKVPQNVEIL